MIRRFDLVIFAVFLGVFTAAVAVAAESEPLVPGLNWGAVIVAVLSVCGVIERVRDWVKANRRYFDIIHDVIESVSESVDPGIRGVAQHMKRDLEAVTSAAGPRIRDLALKHAAGAELRNGRGPGSATAEVHGNKWHRLARTALRLLPFIGKAF